MKPIQPCDAKLVGKSIGSFARCYQYARKLWLHTSIEIPIEALHFRLGILEFALILSAVSRKAMFVITADTFVAVF